MNYTLSINFHIPQFHLVNNDKPHLEAACSVSRKGCIKEFPSLPFNASSVPTVPCQNASLMCGGHWARLEAIKFKDLWICIGLPDVSETSTCWTISMMPSVYTGKSQSSQTLCSPLWSIVAPSPVSGNLSDIPGKLKMPANSRFAADATKRLLSNCKCRITLINPVESRDSFRGQTPKTELLQQQSHMLGLLPQLYSTHCSGADKLNTNCRTQKCVVNIYNHSMFPGNKQKQKKLTFILLTWKLVS